LTSENGNGEVKQLLEIKRNYHRNLVSLEMDLKAKFEHELAEGKKRLQGEYLENIVDVVFAETPAKEPAPLPEPAPAPAPAVLLPEAKSACPECGSPISPSDKFCPQCAFPVKEDLKNDAAVVSAGRRRSPRCR